MSLAYFSEISLNVSIVNCISLFVFPALCLSTLGSSIIDSFLCFHPILSCRSTVPLSLCIQIILKSSMDLLSAFFTHLATYVFVLVTQLCPKLYLIHFFQKQSVCCVSDSSCPTLCDPKDLSPPGSSVHGLF